MWALWRLVWVWAWGTWMAGRKARVGVVAVIVVVVVAGTMERDAPDVEADHKDDPHMACSVVVVVARLIGSDLGTEA